MLTKIGPLESLTMGPAQADVTLILMHGRGTTPDDLAPLAHRLPEGVAAILPQAPFPFPPEMPFGRAWYGMPPGHEDALRESAGHVKALLDEVTGEEPERARRVILAGFSQGGVMALQAGLGYEPRLAGVICMSGYLFEMPALEGSTAPPVCIVHGRDDDVVDVQRARKTREELQQQGIEPEYAEFDISHTISEDSWAYVTRFMERVLSE